MISQEPHMTKDSVFITTSPSSPKTQPITIYLISGNPGLISYYHVFVSLLSKKLQLISTSQDQTFNIVGHSLAGFELEQTSASASKHESQKGGSEKEHYHDLEDQIQFAQGRLEGHMRSSDQYPAGPGHDSSTRPKVILIGHSVGTYIAMEILRRYREEQINSNSSAESEYEKEKASFDIIGGIMLFPTVMDIAKSPSGQKLTFLLRLIPQLALVVSFLARILTTLLPDPLLKALVRFVMQFPPETAVESTTSFLKSRRGVRQALHLGADEMRTITSDKWSDDVWGVSTSSPPSAGAQQTQLFFYFGRNDHWVAEQTRDEIVAARGAKDGQSGSGPKMIVCEESVSHAFCLRHNDIMANKVADMVREITE
ncbi:hypothetical protein BDV18DRAFT_138730 [Aspergillus unguis]